MKAVAKFFEHKYWQYLFFISFLLLLGVYIFYFYKALVIGPYLPSRADPIAYYLDIKGFYETGSIVSPYIIDEGVSKIAEVGFHGPGYTIFYGILAKIFGFHQHLMLYINILLMAGIIYAILRTKFLSQTNKYALLTIELAYFTTLWNNFAFTPEFFHIFFGNFIALQMVKLFSNNPAEDKERNKEIWILIAWILIAASFRYSWVMASVALIPLARTKKEFFKFTAISAVILIAGVIYLKLLHAPYYGLVLSNASEALAGGNPVEAFMIIYRNVAFNIPMFFYKYFYSDYYYLTKLVFIISFISLAYIAFKKHERLALSTLFVQFMFIASLFLFFDAFDTRDIRGITGSLIIGLIILAFYNQRIFIYLSAIAFLIVFPNVLKDFRYKIFDLSVESGKIYPKVNLDVFKELKANGKIITVLLPERFYWIPVPNRQPITIKDILHTPSLALPLKNNDGIPIRYTVNNSSIPPYTLHHKIKVDYILDLEKQTIIPVN